MKELITITFLYGDDEYTADGYVHYYEEKNWGADIDGNRGEYRQVARYVSDIVVLDSDELQVTDNQIIFQAEAELITQFEEEGVGV